MRVTTITEAKAQLSRLVEQVQSGTPVVIGKAGKPMAILSAYDAPSNPRTLGGSWEGNVEVAGDFDELPAWFTDHFDGGS